MTDLAAIKARCLYEWENVNDPPCHPSDPDWRPCPLCIEPTEDNTPMPKDAVIPKVRVQLWRNFSGYKP